MKQYLKLLNFAGIYLCYNDFIIPNYFCCSMLAPYFKLFSCQTVHKDGAKNKNDFI